VNEVLSVEPDDTEAEEEELRDEPEFEFFNCCYYFKKEKYHD